jgi:hypothetical protein
MNSSPGPDAPALRSDGPLLIRYGTRLHLRASRANPSGCPDDGCRGTDNRFQTSIDPSGHRLGGCGCSRNRS